MEEELEDVLDEQEQPKKGNKVALIIVIICLVLSLGSNAFLFLELNKAGDLLTEVEEAVELKDSLLIVVEGLEEELNAQMASLAYMKDNEQYNLDSINILQQQIEDLMYQLEEARYAVRTGDPAKLAAAQKQLEQLKGENQILKDKVQEATDKYSDTKAERDRLEESLIAAGEQAEKLEEEKKEIQAKVKQAAKLQLSSTIAIPTREKRGNDEQENKASKVEKIMLELTVLANELAERGKKELFVVITGPGKVVLSNNNQTLTNSSDLYSIKKTIDYDGSEEKLRLTYKQKAEYKPGLYSIKIIIDGNLAGRTEFTLR